MVAGCDLSFFFLLVLYWIGPSLYWLCPSLSFYSTRDDTFQPCLYIICHLVYLVGSSWEQLMVDDFWDDFQSQLRFCKDCIVGLILIFVFPRQTQTACGTGTSVFKSNLNADGPVCEIRYQRADK